MKSPEFDALEKRVGRKSRKYAQLRDLQVSDHGVVIAVCISCNRTQIINSSYDLKKWHAGHLYKEKGSSGRKSVAYDTDNLNLQCYYCNVKLSGNETNYCNNLVKKIGEERFEALRIRANEIKIYSFGELQQLDKLFSGLIKEQQKRLNKKW